jgi:hypothetical protein
VETFRNGIYTYGFGIVCGLIAALLICSGLRSKKSFLKYLFYNLSAVFIALFFFEAYGFLSGKNTASHTKFSGTFFDNPNASGRKKEVGFGPREDTSLTATASRTNDDTLIYSVTYFLEKGIRKTPGVNPSSPKPAWFLGCSFTFGDGLNDDQTLPFYFNAFTNSRFHVMNYGFSGYGPHQALKITEEKIVNLNSPDSGIVIFSFVPDHFLRAAGKAAWDMYGPWYEVENGQLVYKGTFEDKHFFKPGFFTKRIGSLWQNSNLYRSVFAPAVKEKDIQRVIGILKKMTIELSQRHLRFYTIVGLMDQSDPNTRLFYKELTQNNIPHFFIDSIIPGIRQNEKIYFFAGDGHPRAVYNQRVAEFLSKHIPDTETQRH